MPSESIECSFPGIDGATADVLAGDLVDSLEVDVPAATIERIRSDPLTQDFGATVLVILSAPAFVALASGVSKWLARRSDASVHMHRTDSKGRERTVTVHGQIGRRADDLIREFLIDD
ncbi:hypothetical protein [Rhodococcus koreensis]|uniref:hypothetical protein n=1 Tax=Rhodococcus koreensis TaxID=99653 RepID=UPI0036D8DD40